MGNVKKSNLNFLVTAIVLIGIIFVSGCSQVPQTGTSSVQTPAMSSNWEQRKATLSRKNNWNLKSKVALSYQEEHWQFGLDWAQKTAQQYVMQIKNPLTGSIVAKLSQNHQGATLLSDNGKTYRSSNAEQLLLSQTRVSMPLNGMQYWVRGITSPQYKVDKIVLDNQGRPKLIQQAGWLIQYPRYQGSSFNALPGKITFKRAKDNVSVKLVAKQWQGI